MPTFLVDRMQSRPPRSLILTRRRALAALFACALLGVSWPHDLRAQDDAAAARSFMSGIANEVVTILRDMRPEDPTRKAKLSAVFARTFDVPQMARFAIGRSWDIASEADKARYVPLFERYVVNLYADRFSGYSGETVEITGTRPEAGGQMVVTTQIKRPGEAAPIVVEYRLRSGDGRFHVVDVVVEGLSLLVTKRSEFAAVLSREGLKGLMERLERQAAAG